MEVLLVGATGVIGRALLPVLLDDGHRVTGTSRSAAGASRIDALGGTGTVLDLYDESAVHQVLDQVRPEVLISQVTDLPDDPAQLAGSRAANARVRREAVPRLVAAAAERGVVHILVQSVAWPLTGAGAQAVATMEHATLDAGGTVLRYGQLYGEGTFHPVAPDGPAVSVQTAAARTAGLLSAGSGIVTITD